MCGICGIVDFSGRAVSRDILEAMTATLDHRGPDDRGVSIAGAAGLGHTRLSIIDLTSSASQPMASDDGRAIIAYNGEVYNFRELRTRLESRGLAFNSRSDTEVVLKAYLEWGSDAFKMLDGMFALAIWDERSQELILARDRFGIKPLYYYQHKAGIAFGSEIKAILASGFVDSREINFEALGEYLFYGNTLGDRTLFNGIQRLLPGTFAILNKNGLKIEAYWKQEEIPAIEHSVDEAAANIKDLLESSIKAHLVSDVPVGVFLSGGIDSSCITAFASRHYTERLQTFSVGFDYEKGVNELPKALQVAEYFNTDHNELHIQGANLPDVIESLVECHDEPFADAANIPLYLLCRELNGSPKVILQGDGGDEIFAGYRRYNVLAMHRFLEPAGKLGFKINQLTGAGPGRVRRARFLSAMKTSDAAERMALLLTTETLETPPTRVLSGNVGASVSAYDPFSEYRRQNKIFGALDPVQRMLYTDTRILLPCDFLEKVDKSTMAQAIEIRVPMLDRALTEYAMGLPSSYKVRKGQKKWLLRKALRGVLPNEILDGPKTGFGVPFEYWLKEPLADYMRSVLLDPAIIERDFFDRMTIETLISEHTGGKLNHGFILWKCLHLALWMDKYNVKVQ